MKKGQKAIIKSYDSYNFCAVIKYIYSFCSISMGGFYLDIIKDDLNNMHKRPSDKERRSISLNKNKENKKNKKYLNKYNNED